MNTYMRDENERLEKLDFERKLETGELSSGSDFRAELLADSLEELKAAHTKRYSDNEVLRLQNAATRLRALGCEVEITGTDAAGNVVKIDPPESPETI